MILVAAENAKKMQVRRFFEKLSLKMITKDGGQLIIVSFSGGCVSSRAATKYKRQ